MLRNDAGDGAAATTARRPLPDAAPRRHRGLITAAWCGVGGHRLPTQAVRRLRRHCIAAGRGATTVEFAMVGGTFCMLLVMVGLFSLYYLRVTMLDLAVQKVSRELMLNQTLTQTQFAIAIQAAGFGLLNSQTINVAVQSASTFGGITPVANVNGGGTLPYSAGSNGSDVLVQVGYTDNSLGLFLPNFLTNVASTIAFQREPSVQ